MSTFTQWGANELMRILFSHASPLPGSYYLALAVSGSPNPYMNGYEIAEPTPGSGYARLLLPSDGTVWDSDDYQSVYNRSKLTWTEATSTWGVLRYWALCNAATEGDVYCYGGFSTTLVINAGDVAALEPASLKITMLINVSDLEL